MSRTVNMIGMGIARSLEERGQVGADAHGDRLRRMVSGYCRLHADAPEHQLVLDRDGVSSLSPRHTATRSPTTSARSIAATQIGVAHRSPWLPGWWRLKDAVDYMLTASMSVLDYATKHKEELLYNRYQAGRDQIRRSRAESPRLLHT